MMKKNKKAPKKLPLSNFIDNAGNIKHPKVLVNKFGWPTNVLTLDKKSATIIKLKRTRAVSKLKLIKRRRKR